MLPARSAPLAFGSPSLPLPSSNARHPASAPARCARPRPPLESPNFRAGPVSTACLVRHAFERLTVIAVWSSMVYVAFGSPSLPLPSSNARHPASAPARCARPVAAPAHCARPRPPFGASKLHSLKRLQSHELKPVDEYCTTPFCNGAFRGEIRYTCAPS